MSVAVVVASVVDVDNCKAGSLLEVVFATDDDSSTVVATTVLPVADNSVEDVVLSSVVVVSTTSIADVVSLLLDSPPTVAVVAFAVEFPATSSKNKSSVDKVSLPTKNNSSSSAVVWLMVVSLDAIVTFSTTVELISSAVLATVPLISVPLMSLIL